NEINHAPLADWSQDSDYRLSGRTGISADDEWVELYIKDNGLDLTSADWTFRNENIGGSVSTGQLLNMGTGYQYIGTGTVSNTDSGDYLLIQNPTMNLTDNANIQVSYLATVMDDVTYNSTNTDLLDETIGRNASSLDTDSGSDWSRNHGTPGLANETRVANVYEAEIYAPSSTGAEHGADVYNAGSSRGIGVRVNSASDMAGNVYQVQTNDHQALGTYKATLRMKSMNATLSSSAPFAEFRVQYPNGSGGFKTIGHAIRGRDFTANNTYRNFVIEFKKPVSSDVNKYTVGFLTGAGTDIIIDKIEVQPFTANNTLPRVYQGENMGLKAGSRMNDGGTGVAFGPKGEAGPGTHVTYGPYTASHINGIGAGQFNAAFRMRFGNITGAATDAAARIEVFNPQSGMFREKVLRVQDIAGTYGNFNVQFPSTGEGSLELRVLNFGAADVYFDKVTVTSVTGAIMYESEADFEYPIGTDIVNNGGASGGQEIFADITTHAAGFMQRGPHALDQTGTGNWYEASFKLRSGAVPTSNDPAALLFVRNIDTGDILASSIVHARTLNTAFRDYKLTFKSPATGRVSYDVYFTRLVDVYSDNVIVTELPGNPDPRNFQVEELRRWNNQGIIVEDALATNSIGHTTGFAVQGTNGVHDNKTILYSDTQEIFGAGNWEANFYVRRTAASGSGAPIVLLEVWDESEGFKNFYQVAENELTNGSYTQFTVPFTKSGAGRIYYKIFFMGGLSNSVLVDRIELDKV
ncbi:MAG: hypothetical protein ACE5DX_05885, partial [Candidatus Dojkabacteria bacterium]